MDDDTRGFGGLIPEEVDNGDNDDSVGGEGDGDGPYRLKKWTNQTQRWVLIKLFVCVVYCISRRCNAWNSILLL